MAKGGDSKREKLEAPSDIIVWSPSKEKEPPIVKEGLITASVGSGEPLLDTATRSEGASLGISIDADERGGHHKRRFWGLLLVPCLVFSNVLIALNWDTEHHLCSSDGDPTASGSITLDGAEYDLYRFDHDDLDSGGRFRAGDGECGLSDWNIRTADEIDLIVRTSGYSAYDACSLEGDNKCDDAVVQGGTTWIPMERCTTTCMMRSGLGPVNGYFAFDNGGWFGDGSFLVAVEPDIEIFYLEVDVRPYEPILALFFSIFLTPTALWIVNRWAKASHQPNLRPSAMVAKNVLKVVILHGLSLTCLILLTY